MIDLNGNRRLDPVELALWAAMEAERAAQEEEDSEEEDEDEE